MTRPYTKGPAPYLAVHRDAMRPRAFVLSWQWSHDNTRVGTEGETSRRYFARERDAIAYGQRTYGETAKRVPTFGV